MELFTAKLRRVGNSLSVLVPKQALEELGVGEGDEVEVALFPSPDERRRRWERLAGSMPRLSPFRRERQDRY